MTKRQGLRKKSLVKSEPVLRLISGGQDLVLPGNLGRRIIFDSNDVFDGFIGSDFVNWRLMSSGGRRRKTNVEVYEVTKKGKRDFVSLFRSLKRNPYFLCLTQNQIVSFAKNFLEWLPKDARVRTFFLFQEKGEGYIAEVCWDSYCRLNVTPRMFLSWDRHYNEPFAKRGDRLVVPRLNRSVLA